MNASVLKPPPSVASPELLKPPLRSPVPVNYAKEFAELVTAATAPPVPTQVEQPSAPRPAYQYD